MTRRKDKETIEDLEERLDEALTKVKQAEEENWDRTSDEPCDRLPLMNL